MSDKMTPEERRNYNKAEFKRKFGQWWLIYAALAFTAVLSFTSGILLPFRPTDGGQMVITIGGIFAAIYYSLGFIATGEGAFYFWFDKLTDHDKDNTTQLIIAWAMMIASISTSLITALAAAGFIAYWLGVFEAFYVMPLWGQKWVVWAIPMFIVAHLVTGTIFKAVSDEAEYERDAKADIRRAKNTIAKEKNEAKANYWKNNAADLARQLGELEAQEEIANYSRRVQQQRDRTSKPQTPKPAVALASETKVEALAGHPNEDGGK